jgi:hypothetical protein
MLHNPDKWGTWYEKQIKPGDMFRASFDNLFNDGKYKIGRFMVVAGCRSKESRAGNKAGIERIKGKVVEMTSNDAEHKRVLADAIANTALYMGLAVVYRIGDSMYGWAYTAGPLGGEVLNVVVDGVEVGFVSRGGGCVSVVQERE